jgi:hypothetical protein
VSRWHNTHKRNTSKTEYRKYEGKTNSKKERYKNPHFAGEQVIIPEYDTT